MIDYLWLFAVAGGAAILGVAIAYGLARQRKLHPREKEFQEQRVRRLYNK